MPGHGIAVGGLLCGWSHGGWQHQEAVTWLIRLLKVPPKDTVIDEAEACHGLDQFCI